MSDKNHPPVDWKIGYRAFFAAKLRRKLLPFAEMPAGERHCRMFSTNNDVISAQIGTGGVFEPEVLGIIDAIAERHGLKSGTALDIGANIGNHAIWLAQHFRQVIAFEPSPVMAAVLHANKLLNQRRNLHIVETALSDRSGVATLVARRSDHIGTLELDESGASASTELQATVSLRTGDDVLGSLGFSGQVSMVKIDIEGAEVQALSGLRRTLIRDRPVICFEARNPTEGEAIRIELQAAGYAHFFSVRASRLGPLQLLNFRNWPLSKRYDLVPLQAFEGHHYSAVFAWTGDLR